jgi:hypothetical protein
MYYLKCVRAQLQSPEEEQIPERLTDYTNYSTLSIQELEQLAQLVRRWHRVIMVGRNLLARDPTGNSVCIEDSNEFVELTRLERLKHADGSATLTKVTLKVMFFTEVWLNVSFSSALPRLDPLITERQLDTMGIAEKKVATSLGNERKTAEMILGWTNGQLALDYQT